ncbi:MAG: dihydrodipicolinate reductase C-terminal domain-containing protein [Bdellovibrionota bacterium]
MKTKKTPPPRLKLALIGASGRMGQKVLEVLDASDDSVAQMFTLMWHGSTRDPNELDTLVKSKPDLIVDFSKPPGTLAWVRAFKKAGSSKPAALICATGFDTSEKKFLESALRNWRWALVPNTSLGVYAMAESLKALAKALPEDYVFSIHESHHAKKVDSPSGTGLLLKTVIEKARTSKKEIQISSVRGGSDPGTHTVTILGPFEKIVLTHAAEDRRLFARGALTLGLSLVKSKKKSPLSLEELLKA